MDNAELLMRILTSSLFCVLGYFLSRKIAPPKNPLVWALLVLFIFLSDYVMPSARVLGIGSTGLYVNNTLQGFGIGLLCGYAIRGRLTILQS